VRTTTYATVYHLGSGALLARDRLADYAGFSLPDNQWQIEAQGWFETGPAKLPSLCRRVCRQHCGSQSYGSITKPRPATDPARPDILRHVLHAANMRYGRLSILTVPRS
jgi:hypothetical protein